MKSLGAKIDALASLRDTKRDLEEKVKAVENEMKDLELELIEQMDKEGVQRSTGKLATVSIGTAIKPSVEDWDEFYKYIHKYKFYHLLERRPSVTGCRELFEKKGKIPGVVPFTQRKLNLRSL